MAIQKVRNTEIIMASNETIAVTIESSRKPQILPFIADENRLSAGRAWKEWLEELER